jgi:hypothetical protein
MIYEILNEDGEVTNRIAADIEFMLSNYPDGNYNELPEPSEVPYNPTLPPAQP